MELIALLWNQANDPLMCWAWHSKTTVFMSSEWLVQRMIRRPLLEKTLHRSKCLKCNVICGKFIVCSVDDSIQCALLCAVCSMYVHIKECAHLCRNVHICEQCAHACAYMWMCSARMCSPLCSAQFVHWTVGFPCSKNSPVLATGEFLNHHCWPGKTGE